MKLTRDEHIRAEGALNALDIAGKRILELEAERDEMKRQRDIFALGLEAEEKDCAAAEAERDSKLEEAGRAYMRLDAKHAELEAERDALEAQLNALQEVWRTNVGDGTDKLTPAGLKSLIEDYQTERDEMKDNAEIGEALLDAIKNFQPNYNWNTCPSEIVLSLTNERDALQKRVEDMERPVSDEEKRIALKAYMVGPARNQEEAIFSSVVAVISARKEAK